MRIFGYKLKNFLLTLTALFLSAFCVGCICVMHVSRFGDFYIGKELGGMRILNRQESIFYLHSPSSQGMRKENLFLRDISAIRGESVVFEIMPQSVGEGVNFDEIASVLAVTFGAEILFTEEVSGIKSYYCYTEKWLDGVALYGEKINLHIAFKVGDMWEMNGKEFGKISAVMGSPIIFDGY